MVSPVVAVIMGSQSDWPTMQHAASTLQDLDVPHEVRIVSAHRTPDRLAEFARAARGRGLQVIVAGATDNFRVVITMCDATPQCRSGQAIVADTVDGKPLTTDGAFKLILTEDKKPARWARNLQSLTVRTVDAK